MSVPCKFERSLLSHDEYETIRLTHHPAIYDVEPAELEAIRSRLRKMRAKEQTLSRQKQREARGKRGARGASFPGTAERPSQRKQVFAAALKRINKELERLHNLARRLVQRSRIGGHCGSQSRCCRCAHGRRSSVCAISG